MADSSSDNELQETLEDLKSSNTGGWQEKGKRKVYNNNNYGMAAKLIENQNETEEETEAEEKEVEVEEEEKVEDDVPPNVVGPKTCEIVGMPKKRHVFWQSIFILLAFISIMFFVITGKNPFTSIYKKLVLQPPPELPIYQQWYNKLINGFK